MGWQHDCSWSDGRQATKDIKGGFVASSATNAQAWLEEPGDGGQRQSLWVAGDGCRCHAVSRLFHLSRGFGWSVVGRWLQGSARISWACTKIYLGTKPLRPSTWKHPRTGSTGLNTGQASYLPIWLPRSSLTAP
jgi:hypothetical protein